MKAWPLRPGIPAAGHVTSSGAWHPGRIEGCVKCKPYECRARTKQEKWARSLTDRGLDNYIEILHRHPERFPPTIRDALIAENKRRTEPKRRKQHGREI